MIGEGNRVDIVKEGFGTWDVDALEDVESDNILRENLTLFQINTCRVLIVAISLESASKQWVSAGFRDDK